MIEKALQGSKGYWTWIACLLAVIAIGGMFYVQQWNYGLGVTGMSRDVSWGLYISQFTFLVGVAAGGLMLVLPYYLHNYKEFGRITILGEFMAIAAIIMCLMFIIADLGQPMRALNVLLYPTPQSMLFWDMVVLNGYLALNLVCGWAILHSEYKGVKYANWVKPFIYLSIPWAISIHTVTAFLYAGLPGRDYWLTAILAPRFLASAFAAGPALLLIIALIIERNTLFRVGQVAKDKLVTIISYAAIINFFFLACEFFSAYYSQYPSKMYTKDYLFFGLEKDGNIFNNLVPYMQASVVIGVIGIAMIFYARSRKSDILLGISCALIFLSLWIDKGLGMVLGGFVPNPMGQVTQYYPSIQELGITAAVWATGFLVVTLLYKVAISVKLEKEL
ncbi:sulfate reduction electron transfer complex DsrMKJOP subunit DsrP [Desulfurivibrio dismutans]|uniref:sulfate reduction electron transfer complex DsrMKJOP subunit DsrP n=1 Tax=Desulfurivibrio dismutans TaxID=1398908 RepID=UPI0023DA1B88|nr:NrfD/PsrC family molybdoenzyme membrane anchor subunit [Desulfurivibrio alkaliphilus]MDF1615717.1 polysulfide reductase NrfD [Desulfurivibrio alkaliphilus]